MSQDISYKGDTHLRLSAALSARRLYRDPQATDSQAVPATPAQTFLSPLISTPPLQYKSSIQTYQCPKSSRARNHARSGRANCLLIADSADGAVSRLRAVFGAGLNNGLRRLSPARLRRGRWSVRSRTRSGGVEGRRAAPSWLAWAAELRGCELR